jgi:hypothetical protein
MCDSENIPTSKRTTCKWSVSSDIQKSVDKLIKEDPSRYKLAQNFGEFLMDTPFANTDSYKISQDDIRGEKIRASMVINNMKQYGLTHDDLTDSELQLLRKVYGVAWNELLNID